jgi:plastocyanin
MKRLLILATTALMAIVTSAALSSADATRTITIKGTEHFVANTLVSADFRFSPGPFAIKSGETVTWENTTVDPHTISVVNQSDLPTNINQVFSCGAPGTVCAQFFACHFPNGFGPGGPVPPINLACGNAKKGQLADPGDSFLIPPPGTGPQRVTAMITASSGTTLFYMCAIHPWMQGRIDVG